MHVHEFSNSLLHVWNVRAHILCLCYAFIILGLLFYFSIQAQKRTSRDPPPQPAHSLIMSCSFNGCMGYTSPTGSIICLEWVASYRWIIDHKQRLYGSASLYTHIYIYVRLSVLVDSSVCELFYFCTVGIIIFIFMYRLELVHGWLNCVNAMHQSQFTGLFTKLGRSTYLGLPQNEYTYTCAHTYIYLCCLTKA